MINSNMLKLIVMFCFGPQTPFLGKFDPGYQNCQFKMKFGLKINLKMLNLMVMFTFFLFWTANTLFEQTWSKKSKLYV